MKGALLVILIAAYCPAEPNGDHHLLGCSDDGIQGNGKSVLDKALERYISSGLLTSVAIPNFNDTVKLGRSKSHIEFYNAKILGLNFIERVGCNYFEARLNERMYIRVALKLHGLRASVTVRKKNSRGYTEVVVDISLPHFVLVAEIQEMNEILKVTRLDITGIENLKIRFRFLTGILKFLNDKKRLQAYINKKINQKLRTEIPKAVQQILNELGQRTPKVRAECRGCTTFDIYLRNAVVKFGLDPICLPRITQELLARLAQVQVIDGTIRGLSKLRQSGDIITRIDKRGARAHIDVTVHQLSVTFDVNVTTLLTDYTATVSVTLSAISIIDVVEQKTTLVLKQLVVNVTDEVHVDIRPKGTLSSVITFFMPPKVLAEMIKTNIQHLTSSTIQSGLDALYTYAYGGLGAG